MTEQIFKNLNFEIKEIPLEEIVVYSLTNDREDFGNLDELAQNIKKHGMHTEVWARQLKGGNYELFAGHRRYKAHQQLEAVTIKAKVFNGIKDDDVPYLRWFENHNRKNYDTIEAVFFVLQIYNLRLRQLGLYESQTKLPETQLRLLASTIAKYRKEKKILPMSDPVYKTVAMIQKILEETGAFSSIYTFERAIKIVNLPEMAQRLIINKRLKMRPAGHLYGVLKKMSPDEVQALLESLEKHEDHHITEEVITAHVGKLRKRIEKTINYEEIFSRFKATFQAQNKKIKIGDKRKMETLLRKVDSILQHYSA